MLCCAKSLLLFLLCSGGSGHFSSPGLGAERRGCLPCTQLLCACFTAAVYLGYSTSLFFTLLLPSYALCAKSPSQYCSFPSCPRMQGAWIGLLAAPFKVCGGELTYPRSVSAFQSAEPQPRHKLQAWDQGRGDPLHLCRSQTTSLPVVWGSVLLPWSQGLFWGQVEAECSGTWLSLMWYTLYYIVRLNHLMPWHWCLPTARL